MTLLARLRALCWPLVRRRVARRRLRAMQDEARDAARQHDTPNAEPAASATAQGGGLTGITRARLQPR